MVNGVGNLDNHAMVIVRLWHIGPTVTPMGMESVAGSDGRQTPLINCWMTLAAENR